MIKIYIPGKIELKEILAVCRKKQYDLTKVVLIFAKDKIDAIRKSLENERSDLTCQN